MKQRCGWASNLNDLRMTEYHDNEYGVMIYDNNKLFELLSMELMQSGLSWKIILDKRDSLNKRFYNFIIEDVAKMNTKDVEELLNDSSIIRHRLKLEAIINNAKIIVKYNINLFNYIHDNFNKFNDDFLKCSKQYKKDEFKFIGPSTIESLYQALGLIEGHEEICFRSNKKEG